MKYNFLSTIHLIIGLFLIINFVHAEDVFGGMSGDNTNISNMFYECSEWFYNHQGILFSIYIAFVLFYRNSYCVLVINADSIFLRGKRPGYFLFTQSDTIYFNEVMLIEIGRIRRKVFWKITSGPSGDNTRRGFLAERYLWITYIREGREYQIFHPLIQYIKNIDDAIEQIQRLFGDKVIIQS